MGELTVGKMRTTVIDLATILTTSFAPAKDSWGAPCMKHFSVQWIDRAGVRTEGMIITQLKWWDEKGKNTFPGICYDEKGTRAEYVIVMADSIAGYQYTRLIPITSTSTFSGTVVSNTGESSAYAGQVTGPTTYFPQTSTYTWTKIAYSLFRGEERLRSNEISGYWMLRAKSGPYRKAVEQALEYIQQDVAEQK